MTLENCVIYYNFLDKKTAEAVKKINNAQRTIANCFSLKCRSQTHTYITHMCVIVNKKLMLARRWVMRSVMQAHVYYKQTNLQCNRQSHTHIYTYTVALSFARFHAHLLCVLCLSNAACFPQLSSDKLQMTHATCGTNSHSQYFFTLQHFGCLLVICSRNMKQARTASINSKTTTTAATTTTLAAVVCTVAAVNFRTTCVKVNTCDMRIIPCGASNNNSSNNTCDCCINK